MKTTLALLAALLIPNLALADPPSRTTVAMGRMRDLVFIHEVADRAATAVREHAEARLAERERAQIDAAERTARDRAAAAIEHQRAERQEREAHEAPSRSENPCERALTR